MPGKKSNVLTIKPPVRLTNGLTGPLRHHSDVGGPESEATPLKSGERGAGRGLLREAGGPN